LGKHTEEIKEIEGKHIATIKNLSDEGKENHFMVTVPNILGRTEVDNANKLWKTVENLIKRDVEIGNEHAQE
jgi:hypothetical protein